MPSESCQGLSGLPAASQSTVESQVQPAGEAAAAGGRAPGSTPPAKPPIPDAGGGSLQCLIQELKSWKPVGESSGESLEARTGGEREVAKGLVPEPLTGRGARGGWGEFEKKVERYGKARARAEKMAEYLLSITSGKYQGTKLKQCGTWLRLRHYYTQGDTRVVDANFCHQDRLCPLCAIRRGAKFLKAYVEKFMALDAQGVKFLPHMVNHTVKDGEDLKERVDHLVRGLRAIRQRVKDAQRGKCQTEASKALGAVYSIEIKKGEGSHIWHPHAHSIWPCTSLLDVEKLKGEWEEITGDSHQVYAEPFHCVGSGLPVGFESLAGDLAEVFKYALKFSSMTLEDQWLAYWILKRRRLVASWGILYGVKVPENLLDDVTESELPYIEFLLRFVSESGYELEEYSQS